MTDTIRFIAAHWEDILAAVTLVMAAIVGIAHGLVWLASIATSLAAFTATKDDDRAVERFSRWASRMSKGADWLASQHARLMPRRTERTAQ
jgi:hypothetical protein